MCNQARNRFQERIWSLSRESACVALSGGSLTHALLLCRSYLELSDYMSQGNAQVPEEGPQNDDENPQFSEIESELLHEGDEELRYDHCLLNIVMLPVRRL